MSHSLTSKQNLVLVIIAVIIAALLAWLSRRESSLWP